MHAEVFVVDVLGGVRTMPQVTLLQSAQNILTMFSAALQRRAQDTLRKEGVNVRLGVRVVAVTQDQVCACACMREHAVMAPLSMLSWPH